MKLRLALLIAMLVLLAACSRVPNVTLPESAPGWTRSSEVRTFPAKKLSEYIDGEAERYIHNGVQKTVTAEYAHRSGLQAAVDLHVMEAGLGPRQLLGAEPGADTPGVGLGEAARVFSSSLAFRRGRYFVRVVAFGEGVKVSVQLVDLAHAVDQELK